MFRVIQYFSKNLIFKIALVVKVVSLYIFLIVIIILLILICKIELHHIFIDNTDITKL